MSQKYFNNIAIFQKITTQNFSISYQLLHGHRDVPTVQNALSSTSLATEKKRINHADSHGLSCNSTPAQHPHQYQNLGTNSHPQCCARLPFTVLGNSCHYSSIHRKLGVSENIYGINFQLWKRECITSSGVYMYV